MLEGSRDASAGGVRRAAESGERHMVGRLCRDLSGVTAIEYGLIVGAIAVAIIGVIYAMGGDIANLFASAGSAMSSASSSGTY